jgi:hypothetical protein
LRQWLSLSAAHQQIENPRRIDHRPSPFFERASRALLRERDGNDKAVLRNKEATKIDLF